jgi:hypothetical protein
MEAIAGPSFNVQFTPERSPVPFGRMRTIQQTRSFFKEIVARTRNSRFLLMARHALPQPGASERSSVEN